MKVPLTFLLLSALLSLQTSDNRLPLSLIFYFPFAYWENKRRVAQRIYRAPIKRVKAAPEGVLYAWKVKSFHWGIQVHISDQNGEGSIINSVRISGQVGGFLFSLKELYKCLGYIAGHNTCNFYNARYRKLVLSKVHGCWNMLIFTYGHAGKCCHQILRLWRSVHSKMCFEMKW